MAQKSQADAGFNLSNNDEFTFLDQYVDPSWASLVEQTQTTADDNIFAGLGEYTAKESIFMEPLPFDFSSFINPMSSENPSISTQDIFKPLAPQTSAELSNPPSANAFEPSLGAFSDSASPAESHSPSQSASGQADEGQSDSEDDSDDMEDDFIVPSKRATTSRGKGAGTAVAKSKRSATKPKPYPRVSDVVRDAPHKLAADGKRQPASTELKGSVRSADAADDDWRPTMEEYQKMSSKEKRQLRNKISARNFRVRRKEYITTLEGEVAARDQQLETYREELTSTRTENSELRKEIERLKREIMEGRDGGSIFEQSPVDSKSNILLESNSRSTRASRSSIVRPNRNKDLPSSGSTRGFWGGATMGGTTPVHTTLVPDFDISTIAGKPRPLQENINPHLNSLPATEDSQSHSSLAPYLPLLTSGLDGLHNFTFKGLDNDRMQLWSRMAREHGAAQAAKDKLIASPASSTHSSLGSSNGYSTSLSQSNVSPLFFSNPAVQLIKKETSKALSPTPQQAALATTLTTTVSSKLMGALWSAFAPKSTLDLDKVKKVLEGKAELRVVDVESSSASVLEEGLKAMSLGSTTPPAASSSKKSSVELLEEGLKGMALTPAMAARNECAAAAASAACGSLGIFGRPMRAGHTPTPAHQPSSKHAVTAQH